VISGPASVISVEWRYRLAALMSQVVKLLLLIAAGMAIWLVLSLITSLDRPPEDVVLLSLVTTAFALYWSDRERQKRV
jgi:hypothetical protein